MRWLGPQAQFPSHHWLSCMTSAVYVASLNLSDLACWQDERRRDTKRKVEWFLGRRSFCHFLYFSFIDKYEEGRVFFPTSGSPDRVLSLCPHPFSISPSPIRSNLKFLARQLSKAPPELAPGGLTLQLHVSRLSGLS